MNLYSSNAEICTITGSQSFFDDISGNNTYTKNLYGNTGTFLSCSIKDIKCSSISGATLSFIVSSGTDMFVSNMNTTLLTSNIISSESIGSCLSKFLNTSICSLTGNSAFFTTITGTSIDSFLVSTKSLDGISAHLNNITTDNSSTSSHFANSISGNIAYLKTLIVNSTTGSDIYATSFKGKTANFSNISGNSINSSTLYGSNSIETNGSLTSGSINTFGVFSPLGSVIFDSLSGKEI